MEFRCFRNDDPPALVGLWNEAFPGRGAVQLFGTVALEHCVFARPSFDPAGLLLATDGLAVVGFAHACFAANDPGTASDPRRGVTCLLGVRPSHQRRGIGSELLRHSEAYLRGRGAQEFFAGPASRLCPFYLGLYGGADLPGVLDTNPGAAPFLRKHGYSEGAATAVLQVALDRPLKGVDPRFAGIRKRYELQVGMAPARISSWWRNCVLGLVEPLLFVLVNPASSLVAASALAYELEGFSCRWGRRAVGVLDFQVRPECRRQGLGKFLLFQMLRYIQEQSLELAELQVSADNLAGLGLARAIGFTQVDVGRIYQKGTGIL